MESTVLRSSETKSEICRIFSLEGSEVKIIFRYSEKLGRYIGDFPDFEQEPLYTDSGKPWVCAAQDMCGHGQCKDGSEKNVSKEDSSIAEGADCGYCMFFIRERDDDLIGVCGSDACRRVCSDEQMFSED